MRPRRRGNESQARLGLLMAAVVAGRRGPVRAAEDRDARRPSPTSARRAPTGPPGSSWSARARWPTPTTAPTRSPWSWTSPRWTPPRCPPGSTWAPARSSRVRVTSLARADGRNLARLEVRLASLVPYQIYSKDKALNLVFERAGHAPPPAAPGRRRGHGAARRRQVRPRPPGRRRRPQSPAAAPRRPSALPAPSPGARAAGADRRGDGRRRPRRTAHPRPCSPRTRSGQLAVTVKADGRLQYQDFFLGNPDRLVVDFTDVVSRGAVRPLEVNQGPVRKVRLGQFSAASPEGGAPRARPLGPRALPHRRGRRTA